MKFNAPSIIIKECRIMLFQVKSPDNKKMKTRIKTFALPVLLTLARYTNMGRAKMIVKPQAAPLNLLGEVLEKNSNVYGYIT